MNNLKILVHRKDKMMTLHSVLMIRKEKPEAGGQMRSIRGFWKLFVDLEKIGLQLKIISRLELKIK
jgi:hypothetical protein